MLRDNGLSAALEDNAGRSPVPVTVDVDLPRRLPDHIETTAYFVATETLANVAKHSGATAARLFGRHRADTLLLEITDNGVGGAEPGAGSGPAGLSARVDRLSPREREVLALMAQGRSNASLATELSISDAAVDKHVRAIFTKLDLPTDDDGHRRVMAVLTYLRS